MWTGPVLAGFVLGSVGSGAARSGTAGPGAAGAAGTGWLGLGEDGLGRSVLAACCGTACLVASFSRTPRPAATALACTAGLSARAGRGLAGRWVAVVSRRRLVRAGT